MCALNPVLDPRGGGLCPKGPQRRRQQRPAHQGPLKHACCTWQDSCLSVCNARFRPQDSACTWQGASRWPAILGLTLPWPLRVS